MLKPATVILDVLVTLLAFQHMVIEGPKAIHEGNGTLQLFITKNANEKQRQAVVNIFIGRAKGEGPFAIFGGTLKYILDPQYVAINSKVENFINPVTREEQDTKIQLPKGFIFKLADAVKTKVMRILTPNLNFDDSGKNAFYSMVEFKGP